MFSTKIILTGIIIAVAVTFIQWFFTGFLFHKYQAVTPGTWRKESSRSYAISTLLSLLFAFVFAIIFSLWKSKYAEIGYVNGLEFAALCWLAFSIPVEIGSFIYMNIAPMFVVGRCISSLVEYSVAAIIAVWLL